ncbi:MAG: HAMP domain-containing histidine kinase [Clostridia bacterium]|nr:HAMP domain-containing histidine kinase [Clostridia bacterium]
MFKSVFAKYVITFMALLVVSFLLLLFIVNSVVSNDSLRAEQNNMVGVATSCADHLSEMFEQSGMADFGDFIRADSVDTSAGDAHVLRLLSAIMTNFEDMTVYVTDASGGFIFCTGKASDSAPAVGTPLLSQADFSDMSGERVTAKESAAANMSVLPVDIASETETETALTGIFFDSDLLSANDGSQAYVLPITTQSGVRIGHVIVTSTAEFRDHTMDATLRSMIVAALWIILAALIAIYFITEQIISPLREMSRAAKKMAVGQFDVRVPVHGKDEVAELAVAFNQMTQALDNLERMRNSFVANVSHDLRTPMTTIAGFIDGILDGVIPPEQSEHYLKIVSDEVRRLSRLVTALLDVSRLQAGDRKFDMKPFDVCEMGRQILISFEKKIDDKRLDVEFACDEDRMFVLADRDAIHQILYNICDNAVKFASERGKLKMSFTWSSAEGNRRRKAVVKVYNEGQGIPPEDLPFVFERFYKSDKSRSLDKSGVGLGMFISKTIIDAHGESISVASDYGHNCEFTFTLARTEPTVSKGRAGHVQGGNT